MGLEEKLEAVAKRLGVPKDKVIEALLEAALKKGNPSTALDGLAKLSQLNLDDLLKYSVAKQLLLGDSNGFSVNQILAIAAIRMMTQPDPMTLMLVQKLAESTPSRGSDNELFLKLLEQQLEQQRQMQQLILQVLVGKRSEELLQQVSTQIASTVGQQLQQQQQQINELQEAYARLAEEMRKEIREAMRDKQQLAQYMAQLAELARKQPDTLTMLRQMITTYKELRNIFEEAARELGIKREEYVKGDQVDWNALLNRVFDIAEKYIRGQQAPPMKQVEELPETTQQAPAPEPAPQQEQAIVVEESGGSGGGEAASGAAETGS